MKKITLFIAILIGGICFSFGMMYGENTAKGMIQESAYIRK